MNYRELYTKVVINAKIEEILHKRYKGDGLYYERHHIIPHSLGGSNNSYNLTLLTAKEHYLCHWLLVKCFTKYSYKRKKMLKAWFFMSAIGSTHRIHVSAKQYEKYKSELGTYMSELNTGNKNPMYGLTWYTNRNTGKNKRFAIVPPEEWVKRKKFVYGTNMYIM